MANWNSNLEKGKQAEIMIQDWFGGKLGYDDLLVLVEVKNSWHSGNITIEEDSVVEDGIKGWVYTSRADNVVFVDFDNEQAVLIKMDDLRSAYNKIKDTYELKIQETFRDNKTWHSTHRQIPIGKFIHIFLKRFVPYD